MSFGSRYKGKFATLHPIYKASYTNIKGLLRWTGTVGQFSGVSVATIGKTQGKWYWEVSAPPILTGQTYPPIGTGDIFGAVCCSGSLPPSTLINNSLSWGGAIFPTGVSASIGFRTETWAFDASWEPSTGSPSGCTGGDVFGVCMDLDNNNFYVFRNGVRVTGTASSMPSGTWYPAVASVGFTAATFSINFGATGFAYPSSIPTGFHPGVFDVKSSKLKIFSGGGILSNDRLTYGTNGGDGNYYALGIIGKSSGKWYWEVTPIAGSVSFVTGVVNSNVSGLITSTSNAWVWDGGFYPFGSTKYNSSGSSYGSYFGVGDCIGVALDMDAGQITMYKNGVSQGVMYSGLTGSIYPVISGNANSTYGNTPKYTINFGDTPFNYTPPVGYNPGLYD